MVKNDCGRKKQRTNKKLKDTGNKPSDIKEYIEKIKKIKKLKNERLVFKQNICRDEIDKFKKEKLKKKGKS